MNPLISSADMAEFRALAESNMVDSCTIRRKAGEETDDDGAVVPTYETVYEGKCKVQSTQTQESNPESVGHSSTIQRARVDLPVAKTVEDYKPQVGDLPLIDTATHDPHLAGTEFRVTALLHKTMATAYRLAVTDEVA